jgi:hypothetical protein
MWWTSPRSPCLPVWPSPGATLTVDGGDFSAGTNVKVFLGKPSATRIIGSLVDANGFFNPKVALRADGDVGVHTLIAADETTCASTLFTVV